jgi:hypothetical protein
MIANKYSNEQLTAVSLIKSKELLDKLNKKISSISAIVRPSRSFIMYRIDNAAG